MFIKYEIIMKFKVIVYLVVLFSCFQVSGQFGEISGVVSDEFGPLSGAKVTILETGSSVNCDINGAFSFEIRPGSYELVAEYLLFGTQSKLVSVSFNSLKVEVNFKLESRSAIDASTSIGSRSDPKSQMDNAVAVDIISSVDIVNSGQLNLTGVLQYLVPSFHSTVQTVADGTDHIYPATIR
jgi:iron complex outermembrane receptor protein